MESEKREKIKAHANAIAILLYEDTDPEQVKTLQGIEKTDGGKVRLRKPLGEPCQCQDDKAINLDQQAKAFLDNSFSNL